MRRVLLAVGAAVLLLASAVAPAAAATTPSTTVALDADGNAEVTVVSTYDLTTASEQRAFDDLRANETRQRVYTDRFRDRWRAVANATERTTGREMAVTDVSLSLSREGETGVATVTADWEGLAATADGRLTLSAPFASEYRPDRRFVVVLPEGYETTSVSVTPAESTDGRVVYDAGADLDGFEIAAVPADGTGTTAGSGPGFGVAAALAALAAGVLARSRE